jgi:hypothetical protein
MIAGLDHLLQEVIGLSESQVIAELKPKEPQWYQI